MQNKYKDALRYVILAIITLFTYEVDAEILDYAFAQTTPMDVTIAGLVGTISTTVTGVWVFCIKWFFHTKVGG